MGDTGGFLGSASEWYIHSSLDILAMGDQEIQSQNNFSNTLPLNQVFENEASKESPPSAFQNAFYQEIDQVTRSTASYSVALTDEYIALFLEKYKASEEYLLNVANYFVTQIEHLCKEKYIIPETTPKIESYLKSIKELFPEIDSISVENHQITTQFTHDIQNRDH